MKITRYNDIPQFTRKANYRVDVSLDYLEDWLESMREPMRGYEFNMDPPFQRAHVWNETQQIKFIEYILRGGISGKEIYWNHPNWQGSYKGSLVLVDGKQRIQAALRYLNNEIPAFNAYLNECEERFLRRLHISFHMNVNNLKTDKEVLLWYLDLNDGGTPHTNEEIEKVKNMIKEIENK